MKYLLCLFSLFFIGSKTYSQEDTLRVKYTETVFFDQSKLPPQANMPSSRKVNKILYASDTQSEYIVNKEDKIEAPEDVNRGRWAIKRQEVDQRVYTDFAAQKMFNYTDLFGKEFLVEEETGTIKWKLHSGEQRDILGYTCIKAVHQRDSTTITAWFTPQIQLPVGPSTYQGLPGLILAVSEGDTKVILASEVQEKYVGGCTMAKPTKGDKISKKDFEKLREDKMKEMKEMYNNQGQRMMFIRG